MNRTDLQRLADTPVADAETLLQAKRWPAAYYMLGYAVECALKACVARQFRQDEVPDKTVVKNFYTHRLDQLLSISGAKAALESKTAADPAFQVNWNTVRDWTEGARYDHSTTETKARDMLVAVADSKSGVLPWLKTQW
jgi:HEPN domain-containing protein